MVQAAQALEVGVCLSLSRVQLFATPWTIAHQVPLSMEFSRQEYWSGLTGSHHGLAISQLCGFQQIASPVPASVSLSTKRVLSLPLSYDKDA